MMYSVKIAPGADKVLAKWKKSNPQLFKKFRKIYHELMDHPRTGTGHPEALRGGNDIPGILQLTTVSYTTFMMKKSMCSW